MTFDDCLRVTVWSLAGHTGGGTNAVERAVGQPTAVECIAFFFSKSVVLCSNFCWISFEYSVFNRPQMNKQWFLARDCTLYNCTCLRYGQGLGSKRWRFSIFNRVCKPECCLDTSEIARRDSLLLVIPFSRSQS